jgi:hypothetical protein
MVSVRLARRDEGITVYSNSAYMWTYDAPQVYSLTPSNGPVIGGTSVTIDGINFGVNTTQVYVGNTLVVATDVLLREHTRVIFRTPSGAGLRTVTVRAANRSSTASPISVAQFLYDGPIVSTVTPTSLSTAGSETLTLTGSNFGGSDSAVYGTLVIAIGSGTCTPTSRTDSVILCTTPAKPTPLLSTLAISSPYLASTTFTAPYATPNITSVSGCTADGLRTKSCIAGTTITIVGNNFGATKAAVDGGSALTVTVGGYTCASLTIVAPHVTLTCVLPAGPTGLNLNVVVSRAPNQCTGNFVDYLGPLITQGSLTQYGVNAVGSPATLILPTTAGGTLIAFNGSLLIFGSNATDVVVRYGPTGQPTKYGCTLQEVYVNYIVCRTAAGIGRGHRLVVTSGGISSPRSDDIINYPGPTLVPSSLRLYSNTSTTGTSLLVAATTQGDLIMMDGFGFGTSSADVTITYGIYTCLTPSSNPQTDTRIICRTSPGEGLNYNLTITVGRDTWAQSVTSWDQYSYPLSPVIESITGCDTGAGGTTINCPTDGYKNGAQVMLTISGRYFTLFPVVTIGEASCSPVTNLPSDPTHVVMCPLPIGTGVLQSIVFKQGQYYSRATPLLSYAAPYVTSIMGCATTSANQIRAIDCTRTGGDIITVMGTNFGASDATVLVGGLRCVNVSHDITHPHARLTCVLPANVGLSRPIIVFAQGSAQQLINNILIDYKLCDKGTYPFDKYCFACPNGTYAGKCFRSHYSFHLLHSPRLTLFSGTNRSNW